MERTLESVVVEQCAPTLAGVKPASLFRYQPEEERSWQAEISQLAQALIHTGISFRILKECRQTGARLIYIYRAGWLRQILAEPSNRAFLARCGYQMERDATALLGQLSERLCLEQEFPHEIGVFLGYPLEDVKGFIENRGRNYTCCGCWKAYGDPRKARERFERYHRCTAVYMERFRQGTPIVRLIVVA